MHDQNTSILTNTFIGILFIGDILAHFEEAHIGVKKRFTSNLRKRRSAPMYVVGRIMASQRWPGSNPQNQWLSITQQRRIKVSDGIKVTTHLLALGRKESDTTERLNWTESPANLEKQIILDYLSGPNIIIGDLPNPGIEPRSPALQADSLPSETPGNPATT